MSKTNFLIGFVFFILIALAGWSIFYEDDVEKSIIQYEKSGEDLEKSTTYFDTIDVKYIENESTYTNKKRKYYMIFNGKNDTEKNYDYWLRIDYSERKDKKLKEMTTLKLYKNDSFFNNNYYAYINGKVHEVKLK